MYDAVADALGGADHKTLVKSTGIGIAVVAAIAVGWGAYLQRQHEAKLRDAQNRIRDLDARVEDLTHERAALIQAAPKLLEKYLITLGRDTLKLGYEDRITLYVHDGDVGFTVQARYAPNPNFNKKGRVYYPEGEGCIGQAWEHGHHFVSAYPNPDIDWAGYERSCAEDGMPPESLANIRMRSRLLGAYAIRNADATESIGVVVVESLLPERYTQELLDGLFTNNSIERYLGELLHFLRTDLPDITGPAGKGF